MNKCNIIKSCAFYIYYVIGMVVFFMVATQHTMQDVFDITFAIPPTNESISCFAIFILSPIFLIGGINYLERITIDKNDNINIGSCQGLTILLSILLSIADIIGSLMTYISHGDWKMMFVANGLMGFMILPVYISKIILIYRIDKSHIWESIFLFILTFLIPSVLSGIILLGVWLIHFGGFWMCLGVGILIGLLFPIFSALGLLQRR